MQLINILISEVLGHRSLSMYNQLSGTSFFSSKPVESHQLLVSSIQMGEDCNARIAKSTEIQPRHFHLWEDFRTRKIAQQDSKEGITCLFYLEILEERGYVGLSWRCGNPWLSKQGELWVQLKSSLIRQLCDDFVGSSAQGGISPTQQVLLFNLLVWLGKERCKVKREENQSENIHIARVRGFCCWFPVHVCEGADCAAEQWGSLLFWGGSRILSASFSLFHWSCRKY